MAPTFSKPRHIPHYRRSPDAPLPNYKALLIGINYMWGPDGSGPGDPDLQLKGPVNDAKAMKKILKGERVRLQMITNALSLRFYSRCCRGLLLSRARYFPHDGQER